MTRGEELARELGDCNMTVMMGSRYYLVPYSLAGDIVEALKDCGEHKTGRWVLVEMGDTDLYECSLCRKRKTYMSPFCDMCGANMEGADE